MIQGKMKIPKLSNRWAENGIDLTRARQLTNDFSKSPFGKSPNGLLDFRGILYQGDPPKEIGSSQVVADGDFSSSRFKHVGIVGWTFTRCCFDSSEFSEAVRIEDCIFRDCSFRGIRGRSFFPVRCGFEDCIFENLKLSLKSGFIQCQISRGSFSSKRLQLQFAGGTMLEGTVFKGELHHCVFEGTSFSDLPRSISGELEALTPDLVRNKMRRVNFSAATIRKCEFAFGVDLSEIVPPLSESNCVVRVTQSFVSVLLAQIEEQFQISSERSLAIKLAKMEYREDPLNLFRVAHVEDELKYQGREFSSRFYDCICAAAAETSTRIGGRG